MMGLLLGTALTMLTPSPPPSPSPTPTPTPSPPPTVLALVIGNNAGGDDLPNLSYADDDAVRMAALLEEAGATVALLTRLDDDTRRQVGVPLTSTAIEPPTRAAFDAAVARLARLSSSASSSSSESSSAPTVFLLYFAGHGDAEQGTGSLALEDGRLGYDDLRRTIDAVKATTTHVVLDACNAFFVVHARGASGRAWATPTSAGAALSSTVSDVGVFVSTSAEAQVFEWSQLQGGIFSHALRSGLRGAADADLDGVVTYGELEGFIRLASDGIANAAYIPQMFARPPQRTDALLDVRRTTRLPLRAPTPDADPSTVRLTVRDGVGSIVVDVRPEGGFVPRVFVPPGPLLLEVVDDDGRRLERPFDRDRDAPTTMAPATTTAARGPAGLLHRLFEQPFGPTALHALAARARPPEVFGVSVAQEQRLRLHLQTLRDDAARARLVGQWASTASSLSLAAGFGTSSAIFAGQHEVPAAVFSGGVGAGFAVFAGVTALGVFTSPGAAESAADELLLHPVLPTDPSGVRAARVAQTIETIQAASASSTWTQTALGITGMATAAVAVGVGATALACPDCVEPGNPGAVRAGGAAFMMAGGLSAALAVVAWLQPTDAARLDALMRQDPEFKYLAPRQVFE